MSWILRALGTSIGQKFVMALTGMLLCVFLIVHLAGNLLLYAGQGAYNSYVHKLHEQEWLVKVAEAGLVVLFVAHIALAVRTTRDNRSARTTGYQTKAGKFERTAPDRLLRSETWMFVSGAVVLGFLLLHLSDFTWQLRLGGEPGEPPFDKAVRVLRNPLSFTVYIIGSLILGVHLRHGVSSAFQSLGINHPKYNALIEWGGVAFAAVMGVGFATFPIWAVLVS